MYEGIAVPSAYCWGHQNDPAAVDVSRSRGSARGHHQSEAHQYVTEEDLADFLHSQRNEAPWIFARPDDSRPFSSLRAILIQFVSPGLRPGLTRRASHESKDPFSLGPFNPETSYFGVEDVAVDAVHDDV